MSKLDEIRKKLAEQAEKRDEAHDDQHAEDLGALLEAREEHGVDAVQAVKIPFTPGLPTLVIVRRPSKVEFKRFQDMCSTKNAGTAEAVKAAEQMASVTRVYPARDAKGDETFDKMCEACPGLKVGMGSAAAGLASAKAAEDLKA